jgi:uncharacterized protein (DUF4415 family)
MNTKNKITYGKKDLLTEDDFKNCKIRVTMMLDEDIVNAFKERAKEGTDGYQTLINRALRELLFAEASIEARLKRLEAQVFRKKRSEVA